MSSNSLDAWNKLFLFAPRCLRLPRKCKITDSLASLVKQQLQDGLSPPALSTSIDKRGRIPSILTYILQLGLGRQVNNISAEGEQQGDPLGPLTSAEGEQQGDPH